MTASLNAAVAVIREEEFITEINNNNDDINNDIGTGR